MKGNKASELREKSVEELNDLLKQEEAALYGTRKDLVFRRVLDTSIVKTQRHNIARIRTIMTEKSKGAGA
ncbi:MAG TPA: 50S ribosomal protein L29 [Fimbriimonas sp.]|nr:50S ribosomal protein L29 [Fimbriimonas sp.]